MPRARLELARAHHPEDFKSPASAIPPPRPVTAAPPHYTETRNLVRKMLNVIRETASRKVNAGTERVAENVNSASS